MTVLPSPTMSEQFRSVAGALAPEGGRCTVSGLKGSAPAWLLARLLYQVKRRFLIIAPDSESAEAFYRELLFYSGCAHEILFFPPWDTAPFEEASPVAEITGQRLGTLFRLLDGKSRVVVTTLAAAAQKVLPRQDRKSVV